MTDPPNTGLDHLRAALVVRADVAKKISTALGNQDLIIPLLRGQYTRARAQRAAYYECIKLVDELRATGEVREWQSGGSDGLIEALRTAADESASRARHPSARLAVEPDYCPACGRDRIRADVSCHRTGADGWVCERAVES